jgi:hypothetical protein
MAEALAQKITTSPAEMALVGVCMEEGTL